MRRLIPVFCLCLAAGYCPRQTEYVKLPTVIDPALLTPEPISDFQPKTYRDLAILAAEHRATAERANDKITAIAEIVGPQ